MAIDRDQALAIARKRMRDDFGQEVVILEDSIIERDFGWVFMSAAQAFLETGDPNKSIPGVGPLVVNRQDGSSQFLSTAGPPEASIDIYEQKWRSGQTG